ncbi:immunity protein Imm33 domain-containing protein [Isobaculum melis]|uniref:Immunity protein Imm33 domain-containing protein n=1 Tax=Isobaculum melis TaxID=142588 RepID=A0A1H9SZR4_9LACT|nr:DUF2185 domain-containing protein [Isobaculum melis]SER90317.1 hypothetical protein SAMN04488559_11016 [Isobaculum melis]
MGQEEVKTYIENAGACIVTKSVLNKETEIKWLFRDEEFGNGWIISGKDDSQEYIDHSENLAVVNFNVLANIEPLVVHIYSMPTGDLEFVEDDTGKYFIDTKTGQEIREKYKTPFELALEKHFRFLRKDYYSDEFLSSLFIETEKITLFIIGTVDIPSGEVIVADPICYLYNHAVSKPLNRTIPIGAYPVEVAICQSDIAGTRISAARLKIRENKIVRYELALEKGQIIDQIGESGVFGGVGIDAGIASFCDGKVRDEYLVFLEEWHKTYPKGNHYDDYFATYFQQSYEAHPTGQREEGDFIEWAIPQTGNRITMFASGLGDGFYSIYWGLDEQNQVCEIIIPFMNVAYF